MINITIHPKALIIEAMGALDKTADKVLLVGDACYAAKQYFQLNDSLLLLLEDAQARAVKLSPGQTLINYDEFVALTLSTNQSITW